MPGGFGSFDARQDRLVVRTVRNWPDLRIRVQWITDTRFADDFDKTFAEFIGDGFVQQQA